MDSSGPSQLFTVALRHHRAGDIDAAEPLYRAILRDVPNHTDSLNFLGLIATQRGQHVDAVALLERAVALRPDSGDFHLNLASALKAANRLDDAEARCRRAIALNPRSVKAHFTLATILQQLDRLDAAVAEFEWVAAAQPTMAPAQYSLGRAYQDQGQAAEAIACYRRAVAINPDHADAHWNAALQHLALGEYDAGWTQYEWRWRREGYPAQRFAERSWDGGSLTGRTILLSAEQGFGDTFQFIRYAALVKKKGGTVIVECQPQLKQALAYTPGIDRLVGQGDVLPSFDRHAAMLSLPRLLGTSLESVPADIPYIRPDPMRVAIWRGQMRRGSGFNVGLLWRGNPANSDDRKHSLACSQVAALCATPGTNWFSLQVDVTAPEIEILSRHKTVRDRGLELGDWADTAALIAMLDLVITVDSAVAHLAGAMGKLVWVMLSAVPHWCWLRDRPDTPWYPTARLFRQTRQGEWDGVLGAVENQLRAMVSRRA